MARARCWRRRCNTWSPAASTTTSAAASRATPPTSAGTCRISRRCCTTTRSSRAFAPARTGSRTTKRCASPRSDDKVLADWNGMALRAFAEAGRLLGRDDFVDAARELARFLLATLRRDGLVHHAWRNGTLRGEAYLADQAQLGLGLVELHAA